MKVARTVLRRGKPVKAYLFQLGQQVNRGSKVKSLSESDWIIMIITG